MTLIERLESRTGETNRGLLLDCLDSAASAIMSRRFPFGNWPTDDNGEAAVEPQYRDLQFRIALEMYYRIGSEGEQSHAENGISRVYDSAWISSKLLEEVTPVCGVVN